MMIFNARHLPMEDDLQRKKSIIERQPLMEDYFQCQLNQGVPKFSASMDIHSKTRIILAGGPLNNLAWVNYAEINESQN